MNKKFPYRNWKIVCVFAINSFHFRSKEKKELKLNEKFSWSFSIFLYIFIFIYIKYLFCCFVFHNFSIMRWNEFLLFFLLIEIFRFSLLLLASSYLNNNNRDNGIEEGGEEILQVYFIFVREREVLWVD